MEINLRAWDKINCKMVEVLEYSFVEGGGQVLNSFEDELLAANIYFWEEVADTQINTYIKEYLAIIGSKYENPNLLIRNRHGI
jgi:hypothetical protein